MRIRLPRRRRSASQSRPSEITVEFARVIAGQIAVGRAPEASGDGRLMAEVLHSERDRARLALDVIGVMLVNAHDDEVLRATLQLPLTLQTDGAGTVTMRTEA